MDRFMGDRSRVHRSGAHESRMDKSRVYGSRMRPVVLLIPLFPLLDQVLVDRSCPGRAREPGRDQIDFTGSVIRTSRGVT